MTITAPRTLDDAANLSFHKAATTSFDLQNEDEHGELLAIDPTHYELYAEEPAGFHIIPTQGSDEFTINFKVTQEQAATLPTLPTRYYIIEKGGEPILEGKISARGFVGS